MTEETGAVEKETESAPVPAPALNELRDIQNRVDMLDHRKTGIMLGLFSALDLKPGTIINLKTGMFDAPKEEAKDL